MRMRCILYIAFIFVHFATSFLSVPFSRLRITRDPIALRASVNRNVHVVDRIVQLRTSCLVGSLEYCNVVESILMHTTEEDLFDILFMIARKRDWQAFLVLQRISHPKLFSTMSEKYVVWIHLYMIVIDGIKSKWFDIARKDIITYLENSTFPNADIVKLYIIQRGDQKQLTEVAGSLLNFPPSFSRDIVDYLSSSVFDFRAFPRIRKFALGLLPFKSSVDSVASSEGFSLVQILSLLHAIDKDIAYLCHLYSMSQDFFPKTRFHASLLLLEAFLLKNSGVDVMKVDENSVLSSTENAASVLYRKFLVHISALLDRSSHLSMSLDRALSTIHTSRHIETTNMLSTILDSGVERNKRCVLVIGDGDLSFSVSLAKEFTAARGLQQDSHITRICSTTYDSEYELKSKYTASEDNVQWLRDVSQSKNVQTSIAFDVNICDFSSSPVSDTVYDAVIFNFPFADANQNEDYRENFKTHWVSVGRHKQLLRCLFESCTTGGLLRQSSRSRIIVTILLSQAVEWDIIGTADFFNLYLHELHSFDIAAHRKNGYSEKRTYANVPFQQYNMGTGSYMDMNTESICWSFVFTMKTPTTT